VTITGLDDEWPASNEIALDVNGQVVFSGPSPFAINIQVLANDSIGLDTSYGRVSLGMNLRVFGPPDGTPAATQ
jgi:hypothetical protein